MLQLLVNNSMFNFYRENSFTLEIRFAGCGGVWWALWISLSA